MTKPFNDEELRLMGKSAQSPELKPKPQHPSSQSNNQELDAAPIATANQTIASQIRQTVGGHSQQVDRLWDQRGQITTHIATEYAEVLDPESINQEIACKLVEEVGKRGAVEVPFYYVAPELEPVRRFIPSLPPSAGSLPQSA